MNVSIRKAVKKDVSGIINLIKELADYENASHEVNITKEELEKDGFGEHSLFWAYVAEQNDEIIGMAFYYYRYSTWTGKNIYLEDLVVKTEYRRNGIGKLLFDTLTKEAKKQGVSQMVWQVLDWNKPAINFYKKYKAELDEEWINCKLRFNHEGI